MRVYEQSKPNNPLVLQRLAALWFIVGALDWALIIMLIWLL
jgi:hypothetical protein